MSTPESPAAGERATAPLPVALAVLAWLLAGLCLFVAYGIGTSALQDYQEGVRPALALVAAGLLLLATKLIHLASASTRRAPPRPVSGLSAAIGLGVAGYLFVAAAPGAPGFADSYGEAAAGTTGLWLGLSGLALWDRRLCWRVAWAACVMLLLASFAVAVSGAE